MSEILPIYDDMKHPILVIHKNLIHSNINRFQVLYLQKSNFKVEKYRIVY